MPSNPLGDAFYDDDELSITGSEPPTSLDLLPGISNQPYFLDVQPPQPTQYDAPITPDVPVQQYKPDDRYVQSERTPGPIQSAQTQSTPPREPQASTSALSRLREKPLGSAATKPAVVVVKTSSVQSKVSKARAAARLAAIASSAAFTAAKPQVQKMPSTATAPKDRVEQTKRASSEAPRLNEERPAGEKGPESAPFKAPTPAKKAKASKPSARSTDAAQNVTVAKVLEPEVTEVTGDRSKREPRERRGKDKVRMSSADKMRAQRGMRSSKVGK